MASFRDFLLRFRPAGAPGRPAAAGVPVDRRAELRDELEPLLSLLDTPGAEAQEIRDAAARQAEETRRAGREQAGRILAQAHADAQAAHDKARTAARARAETEAARVRSASEQEAEALLRRGRERIPTVAETITARALALATEIPAHRPPDDGGTS